MKSELIKCCRVSTNKVDDNYVGIVYSNNKVEIIFPFGFRLPNKDGEELRNCIINLIHVLKNSYKLSGDSSKELDKFSNELKSEESFPLYAYADVIIDYMKYGIYYVDKVVQSQNTSKINWKKTIQTRKPVFFGNGYYYTNPYKSKNLHDYDEVSEIEKYCLAKCYEKLNWLFENFTFEEKSKFDDSIESRSRMVTILRRELKTKFKDRDRKLLVNMLEILLECSERDGDNSKYTYGTNYFDRLWESMLFDLYSLEDITLFYPCATWYVTGFDPVKASNLRPDGIYKHGNNYYVFDAKYYCGRGKKALSTLPQTSDIHKQIAYAKNIKVDFNIDGNLIYNSFILPINKDDNYLDYRGYPVFEAGYATCDWSGSNTNYPFYKVALIYYDTRTLIEDYLSRNLDRTNYLSESIEYATTDRKNETNDIALIIDEDLNLLLKNVSGKYYLIKNGDFIISGIEIQIENTIKLNIDKEISKTMFYPLHHEVNNFIVCKSDKSLKLPTGYEWIDINLLGETIDYCYYKVIKDLIK